MLETVSHYQMVSPLVHTIQVIASLSVNVRAGDHTQINNNKKNIQVIAGLYTEELESIMRDLVDLLVGWTLDPASSLYSGFIWEIVLYVVAL